MSGPVLLGTAAFPADGMAPFDARDVRRYMRGLLAGVPGVDLADLDLITSEIATNALLHTASGRPGGTLTVTVRRHGKRLRAEFTDDGGALTVPAPPTEAVTGGRGLMLVAALAEDWGFARHPDGRVTVRFDLLLP